MGADVRSRPLDWEARLRAAIVAAETRRFRWGEFDCCLWACDVVALLRGVDLAASFRGRYDNARGAARALRTFSGGGLDATATKIAEAHGFREIPVSLAQRGDVALIKTPQGDALAIVLGLCAAAPGPRGLSRIRTIDAARAWAV
jgi:hypothetical protein